MTTAAVVTLQGYVAGVLGQPWLWGGTDCVSLLRGALRAHRGSDVFSEAPAWYTDERTAVEVLRATGGPIQWLRERGWSEVQLSGAQTGDVVVEPQRQAAGMPSVGMVLPSGVFLSSSQETGPVLRALFGAQGAAYVLREAG